MNFHVFWWQPDFVPSFFSGVYACCRADYQTTGCDTCWWATFFFSRSYYIRNDFVITGLIKETYHYVPLQLQSQATLRLSPVSPFAWVSTPYQGLRPYVILRCKLSELPLVVVVCDQMTGPKYHSLLIVIIFNFAFIVIIMTLKRRTATQRKKRHY